MLSTEICFDYSNKNLDQNIEVQKDIAENSDLLTIIKWERNISKVCCTFEFSSICE